jgi:hypothetical protein
VQLARIADLSAVAGLIKVKLINNSRFFENGNLNRELFTNHRGECKGLNFGPKDLESGWK